MAISEEILYPLPQKNATPQELFKWKNEVLTRSMQRFRQRHPWFQFKKQDIFNNLGDKCNVPRVFSTLNYSYEISDIIKYFSNNKNTIVFKRTMGHSSKEVKILSVTDKPDEFKCLLTKSDVNIESLEKFVIAGECIIEESLSTFEELIPFDFKCYVIDGIVKFVLVVNRNATVPLLSYFDAKTLMPVPLHEIFGDIPKIWTEGVAPFSRSLTERMKIAIDEAERISNELLNSKGIIFSLDMYVTPYENNYKVWLGEITPRPGALHSNWLKKNFVEKLFEIDL